MPINLLSVGGGTTTLTPASSASNFTLTLPATTGTTVLQNASNNLLMNSGYGSDAVAYGCRAWVNFNGSGTIAIRASGNVSSITDNGTGNYTVNFTTALPDANYSKNVNTGRDSGAVNGAWTAALVDMSGTGTTTDPTTGGFRFFVIHPPNQIAQDPTYCNVAVFR
jgi:hypothetical protein